MGKSVAKVLLIAAIVWAAIMAFVLVPWHSSPTGEHISLIESARNSAANSAVDASGIKSRINDSLQSNANAIAEASGLSANQVQQGISDLDVEDWTVVSLPNDAQVSGTYHISRGGTDATITTYENPSYITVEAYGQNLTFLLPDTAQDYTSYLGYLANE